MANGSGDKLARGAVRATFPSPGQNVSQSKWDSIFGKDSGVVRKFRKTKKKSK